MKTHKGEKTMELNNKTDKQFTDISSEAYREYTFADGKVRIEQPAFLNVSENGHRVLDSNEVSHYVPLGWIHLEWKAKSGSPHFVA
jgi:hypothetical protein